jgi:hypothetical protein
MRRAVALVLAITASVGLLAAPVGIGPTAPADVRAAAPDLTIVTAARYDVRPGQRRVRVTLVMTLTNHRKDTTTRRYYFDDAFLAVMPGSSAHALSWDGAGTPSVTVARRAKDYTLLRFALAERLYSGKSATYRLTFDLKDPGGTATRELRVGETLVSFPVWAFATDDTPGSSVTVVWPAGYDIAVEAGAIADPTTASDGRTIFRTGPLPKPLQFFAYLAGVKPGAFVESTVETSVLDTPVVVRVRSWSDDRPWGRRVGGLIGRALPALGARIGLPWPDYEAPLTVQESISRTTGGYAGLFDPRRGMVEIAYYADDFVVLHEAAHAWFNGALLADRWAAEAFASYYGSAAAFDLDIDVQTDVLTDALRASKIPLNDWGPVGSEDVAREDYAYAAGLALARLIAQRAGPSGLRQVWADAAEGIAAYQPPDGGEETVDAPPDWRGLLDLLEARTDATYDDLWRAWVARPADVPLLDARSAARERYTAVLGRVDGWRLPKPIRDALRAWQFEDATRLLDDAELALATRAEVEDAAVAAGLEPPPTLRAAFEDDDGFDDSAAEAAAELHAIERYAAAAELRPAAMTPVMTLGMWGETPEVALAQARDAFRAGELAASVAASEQAAAIWAGAESLGQGRAFSLGALGVAFLIALLMAVATIRRVRRRRRRLRMATPIGHR